MSRIGAMNLAMLGGRVHIIRFGGEDDRLRGVSLVNILPPRVTMRQEVLATLARYGFDDRALSDGIEVIRVIHGMRDLDRIFGGKGDEDGET